MGGPRPAPAGWRRCAAPTDFERERARRASANSVYSLDGSWALIATSASRLRAEGHLAAVWERLDAKTAGPLALTDLSARDDLKAARLSMTLGRRWRKAPT